MDAIGDELTVFCSLNDPDVKNWAEASIMGITLVGKTFSEDGMLVDIPAAVSAVTGLKIF